MPTLGLVRLARGDACPVKKVIFFLPPYVSPSSPAVSVPAAPPPTTTTDFAAGSFPWISLIEFVRASVPSARDQMGVANFVPDAMTSES